ncbi:hypothetical protein ACSQ8I_13970 [Marinovum sp. E06]|uniref:hypothetical protein n=1 Tax=Marinovum sp. E06 TaxID=3449225 RepID=UPI003EDC29CC
MGDTHARGAKAGQGLGLDAEEAVAGVLPAICAGVGKVSVARASKTWPSMDWSFQWVSVSCAPLSVAERLAKADRAAAINVCVMALT